jgi:hypothetical protein
MKNKKAFKKRQAARKAHYERKRKIERKLLKELEKARKIVRKEMGINFDAVAFRKEEISNRVRNVEVSAGWRKKVRNNEKTKKTNENK